MKIYEIITEEFRSDWRKAMQGREKTPLQTSGSVDGFDTDDVLNKQSDYTKPDTSQKKTPKSAVKPVNKTVNKTTGIEDGEAQKITTNKFKGEKISELNKETLKYIYLLGKKLGYTVVWDVNTKGHLGIKIFTLTNRMEVSLAFNSAAGALPDKVRIKVGTNTANVDRIKAVYRALATRYYPDEPDTFDGTREEGVKIGKVYRRDGTSPSMSMAALEAKTPKDIAEKYLDIVQYLDSFGESLSIPKNTVDSKMPSEKQKSRQYYEGLTYNLITSWLLNDPRGMNRGGNNGAFDRNDSLITIGYTRDGYNEYLENGISKKKPTDDSGANVLPDDEEEKALNDPKNKGAWREHVVPCAYINKICVEICEKNFKGIQKTRIDKLQAKYPDIYYKTVREVAEVIQRNLAIVICSKKEAKYIDYTMKWKTTMPSGWEDGDNILARFIQCVNFPEEGDKGIRVYSKSDGGKRVSE